MPYKKKAAPGTNQFNNLITERLEKRETIKTQIEFRHDLLESQKRVNYQSEFDRFQGAKKVSGLDTNGKTSASITKKTGQSLKGDGDTHRIDFTNFNLL